MYDFKISSAPDYRVYGRLLRVGCYSSSSEHDEIHIYHNDRDHIFPYAAFSETIGDNGKKSVRKIEIDPCKHFLNIASTNVFRNNIYLKKITADKDEANKIYTVENILLAGDDKFCFERTGHDYMDPDEVRDGLRSGDIKDCYWWFRFVDRIELAEQDGDRILFDLREVFDFSNELDRLHTRLTYNHLLNNYKIHKIVKSKLNLNQPSITTYKW